MGADSGTPIIAETSDEELGKIKWDIFQSGSLVLVIMPDAVIEWATSEDLSRLSEESGNAGRFDAGIKKFTQSLPAIKDHGIQPWKDNFLQWSEIVGQFNIVDEQENNLSFSKWLADNHYVGPTSREGNGGIYDELADNFYTKIACFLNEFNTKITERGTINQGIFILDFSIDWRLYWSLKKFNNKNIDVELYNGVLKDDGYLLGYEPVSLGKIKDLQRPLIDNKYLKMLTKDQQQTDGRALLHRLIGVGVGSGLLFENNQKFFDVNRVHIIKMCGVESSHSLALARSWMSARLQAHDSSGYGLDRIFGSNNGSPNSKVVIVGTGLLDPLFASIRYHIDKAMLTLSSARKPVHIYNPLIVNQSCSPLKIAEMELRQQNALSFITDWPTSLALADIARLYQGGNP